VVGSLKDVNLGLFSVSALASDAHRVVRTAAAAKTDKSEDYVFIFQKHGPLSFRQGSKAGTLMPGEVLVLNSTEPHGCDAPDACENISLKVPCSLLRPNSKGFDASCGRVDVADPEIAPDVSSLASHLLLLEGSAAALRLQTVCLDLLTVMIDAGYRSTPGARRSSALSDVLNGNLMGCMRRSFADPDTSIEKIARMCRVPVRTAQQTFQKRGTTFGRELMRLRIEEADRLLRSSFLPISQIAFQCGFSNQGHFSTRYRQHFNTTPRDTQRHPPRRDPNGRHPAAEHPG
jgi:AraC family transcriptional regulator, positive regulator of tynA and feaB